MQRLLLLIAAAALMVTPAIGADISGTWTASFETQLGVQNYTYTFKVAGSKLTGTAKSNLAEGTVDGTVNGGDVTFVENLNYEGMPLQIQYKGKISGDEIKFTRVVVEGITEELVAKRAK